MKLFRVTYDESYYSHIIYDFLFNLIHINVIGTKQRVKLIRSFKSYGSLLEIGCGEGRLLNELKKYYEISGIDISKFAISKASRLIDKNKLKVMDIENGNLKDTYHIIIAFDVLEHLKNPRKTIMKIKKALKKDGIFIFSVPNNFGIFGKIATAILNYFDKTHVSTFKREHWIKLMKDANFKIKIFDQNLFGFFKSKLSRHLSFNLVIVAQNLRDR